MSIVYTEQLGGECWKQSPAGFEKIYIADYEKKDFIAPNKLEFSTIQLIRPARIHTTVSGKSGASAQHTICEISQLSGLLEKL